MSDAPTTEGNAALTQRQLTQLQERTEAVRGSAQTSEDEKVQEAATPEFQQKTYRSIKEPYTVTIVSPNELQILTPKLGAGATFRYTRKKGKVYGKEDIEILEAVREMAGEKQQVFFTVGKDTMKEAFPKALGSTEYLETVLTLLEVPKAYEKEKCRQNLKAIGLAFRIFAASHGDRFPFTVNSSEGGSREFSQRREDGFDANGFQHFRVMSKELVSPTILVCPADSTKNASTSWAAVSDSSVSYLIRSDPKLDETEPQELLVRCPVHKLGVWCDGSVAPFWTVDGKLIGLEPLTAASPGNGVSVGSSPNSQKDQKISCIRNLAAIQSAKESWALNNRKISGTTTSGSEKAIDAFLQGGQALHCSAGGDYNYRAVGEDPTCSLGISFGHTL